MSENFYCKTCDKNFQTKRNFQGHLITKQHYKKENNGTNKEISKNITSNSPASVITNSNIVGNNNSPHISVSYNFLVQNFNDAPELAKLSDATFADIFQKPLIKSLYNLDNKQIIDFIIKKLVKYYVKEDPITQSAWNSDMNRISLFIRENVNNKLAWTKDVEMIKITELITRECVNKIKFYFNSQVQLLFFLKDGSTKYYDKIKKLQDIDIAISNEENIKKISQGLSKRLYLDKAKIESKK